MKKTYLSLIVLSVICAGAQIQAGTGMSKASNTNNRNENEMTFKERFSAWANKPKAENKTKPKSTKTFDEQIKKQILSWIREINARNYENYRDKWFAMSYFILHRSNAIINKCEDLDLVIDFETGEWPNPEKVARLEERLFRAYAYITYFLELETPDEKPNEIRRLGPTRDIRLREMRNNAASIAEILEDEFSYNHAKTQEILDEIENIVHRVVEDAGEGLRLR